MDDGTVDLLVSGHEPRRRWQVLVEFGDAAPGGGTIETALPVVLGAVRAGAISLAAAIRALSAGPAALLGEAHRGIVEGQAAYLAIVDPSAVWSPDARMLRSAAVVDAPLAGVEIRGRVMATIVKGRVAYLDPGYAK